MRIENIANKLPRKSSSYWAYKPKNQIDFIVFHHNGAFMPDRGDPIDRTIADTRWFSRVVPTSSGGDNRWWAKSCPYRFVIPRTEDDIIYQTGNIEEMTAHCGNLYINKRSVSVVLQGDYENRQSVTETQKKKMQWIIDYLKGRINYNPQRVSWHKKAANVTNCPGNLVIPILEQFLRIGYIIKDKIENMTEEDRKFVEDLINKKSDEIIGLFTSKIEDIKTATIMLAYHAILKRKPDEDGLDNYLSSNTVVEVIGALQESEEKTLIERERILTLYKFMFGLDRNFDNDNGWKNFRNTNDPQLYAILGDSKERYEKEVSDGDFSGSYEEWLAQADVQYTDMVDLLANVKVSSLMNELSEYYLNNTEDRNQEDKE